LLETKALVFKIMREFEIFQQWGGGGGAG